MTKVDDDVKQVSERTKLIREQQRSGSGEITAVMVSPNPSSTEGTEERKQRIKERAELDESIFSAGVAAEHQRIREAVEKLTIDRRFSSHRRIGFKLAKENVLAIIDSTTPASGEKEIQATPMSRADYLLSHLAQECAEVIVRCTKAQMFGLNEIQPGQESANVHRIMDEFADVVAMAEVLKDEGVLPDVNAFSPEINQRIEAKKVKAAHFSDYSRQLGRLTAAQPAAEQEVK